ncbi:MASE3 domain-containing sensor histidine kinase [Clostridium sp. ZS2-4]|uniref:MASE3 domain-containing sensor histidine kinase n=1 Tax=Clostridium sp. ZS2-4 TaxID=2987703 RepID=UPI00227D0A98|nr:PocR ligand-binding domain-containing protein [Clostridium sp. ZS2-4]MCY6354658.1 PocR ligand-binding domain-containing protein [Clostridium sp. ZS2-4]
MKYKVTNIIDIEKIEKLMSDFYAITKIPYGLLDLEGNILSGIGWQDICTKFHRANPVSEVRCRRSDKSVVNRLNEKREEYYMYKCPNGIMEAVAPIIVEGEHIANLFCGHFFLEESDEEYFRKQAVEFGYDVDAYLEALSCVPIISKDKLETCIRYYAKLAEMFSTMGLNQLKQREAEEKLQKYNEILEKRVAQRTHELVKANEQLKESEGKYRNLLQILPYSIIVRNKETILFANKVCAKYLKIDNPEQIIGKKLSNFIDVHPDYEDGYQKYLKFIEKEGFVPLMEEKYIRKKDGKILEVETVVTTITDNGEKLILEVCRDISERKNLKKLNEKVKEKTILLEETLEYDRLKTEFFSNISHELKTPINVIFSAVQITNSMLKNIEIFDNDSKNKTKKYLGIMRQNCFRLIRLVNNLLDITKIDSGYFKIDLVNCDIVKVVEDITLSVVEYVESIGINLIFDTDIEEKTLACDPDKIERIMLNLLSNAVKFTKSGGKIFVNILDKGQSIIISVKDTGIGIPEEKQKQIFERFIQVDKSLSRQSEGSGIGLALVKSIVEMHEGDIHVNSMLEKGTEFIIELPVKVLSQNIKIENNSYSENNNIEKVKIEFSDIYV